MIPKSIFDDDFTEGHIGWCKPENYNRLFELNRGSVYVGKEGSLKYIAISRRTRLDLIMVDDPKGEFIKRLNDYTPKHKTSISRKSKI